MTGHVTVDGFKQIIALQTASRIVVEEFPFQARVILDHGNNNNIRRAARKLES